MSVIESACNYAVGIANDNSHGYDQIHRWLNPDVDCSSLVILSFENAGVKVREAGATYTGNMRSAFKKCGFTEIKYSKGMTLLRGDVLLNEKYHTCLCLGDNKIVQASINEKGTATGGKGGDQTGREVAVGNFYEYSKGWDYVLRYPENKGVETCMIEMQVLSFGSVGEQVKTMQIMLNANGFKGANNKQLTVDGQFGSNSVHALKQAQKAWSMNPDGICGQKSWTKLLKG